ncbi:UdgX family uracil-DNA binding protein [Roseomonas sp. OT10]|uniref:UdgX family uracil-DNA binding protein n=1 Tax=Roseomonas cutis TaxID=2897332 RepID=UPI001E34654A|nr:UdgX family uracil-DNA binding protein [Roseomonas sp. OT10]UFN50512.1 UdgX family uracil-DNA binding protein [Roseomonas sp. OT10]
MHSVALDGPADFAGWRAATRRLVMAGIAPEEVAWRVPGDPAPLFGGPPPPEPPAGSALPRVPRAFLELAELVVRHRDPQRFALLHRLLARLQDERALLEVASDPDVSRAEAMARAVRRDAHKMHAFVRFREVPGEAGEPVRYVAWFEPQHHILEAEAGFFRRRFAAMRWSILTPEASAHWDGEELRLGPGAHRADAPAEDAAEELWRAYFASIFNPARLKPEAMRAEMPKRYWRNLPEARDIPTLIAAAPARVAAMVERGATEPAARRQRPLHLAHPSRVGTIAMSDAVAVTLPEKTAALEALGRELAGRNDLPPWTANATQMVFGEGPVGAPLMFVGEQPGDEEDLKGRPFVGPAGRLFDRAMAEAGIGRDQAYVTNAVKHFKFTPTGKRRLHQTPDAGDITYYRPFLQREIDLVSPRLVVALGATALRAVSGRAMPVTKVRGSLLRGPDGRPFFATVHPSYLLRIPDEAGKAREYERFVEDLAKADATARALPAAA